MKSGSVANDHHLFLDSFACSSTVTLPFFSIFTGLHKAHLRSFLNLITKKTNKKT